MNARQLRSYHPASTKNEQRAARNEIYILLDNVLDTYNIGSAFRLADAVGAKRLILCGGSLTPPDPRIKKASINTTDLVDWQYYETATEAIKDLKFKISNLQVVAVEQSIKSVPYHQFGYKLPVCVVVGHESEGISREVLEMADGVVELPMFGVNISLNVVVSLGIVLFKVIEQNLL